MKTYTREEIEIGFDKWNNYVANGGDVMEYNPKDADNKHQADMLISFINEVPSLPSFPEDRKSKHEEG